MNEQNKIESLEQLLERISETEAEGDQATLKDILQVIGNRSFGTFLLLAGIITLAPIIGDIPGVPTLMAIIVFLTSIQLLLNKKGLWLPDFLLNRSADKKKLHKTMKKMKTPAQYIDRLLKPRLIYLVNNSMIYVIAVICLGIALVMPVMEFIPFSANLAGVALTSFGLALIARDGLLALIAYVFTAGIIVLGVFYLF